MSSFEDIYKSLNTEQKRAVDTIEGPLLVIAGPGTGKTQLLSARVANILRKTDTLPQNILCLTFTESGAQAMRERLTGMIGTAAYDVHISTYHAFGSEIINRYPEFFESISTNREEDIRYEQPIDELSQLQLIIDIIDKLPFDNPMISARYHPKDVISTISELKRGLITPEKLRQTAQENLMEAEAISPDIQATFGQVGRMPKYEKSAQIFGDILTALSHSDNPLAVKAHRDLEQALDEAAATKSTKPITAWKDEWIHKNDEQTWGFTNTQVHHKLEALADVYAYYEKNLRKSGKYDYDDMIIAAIHAIENEPELKANLQEKYQYLLLDEFQDTNAAQFKLMKLIADHPVHEGRPNVMAVGDDDQAIFAFQGADVSNMLRIDTEFHDAEVINLTRNYRSHGDILQTAHNVAEQIETRLHTNFDKIDKNLLAAGNNLPDAATIERHEFSAQASEYDWIAEKIEQQINKGVSPKEIAVLAPKHKLLEALVPFLQKRNIPVSYEKREDILDTPIIQGLVLQCQLIDALSRQNIAVANELFPIVLSLDFWKIPTESIWRVNWAHSSSSYKDKRPWADIALEHEDMKQWVLFMLKLGSIAKTTPLEYILDALTGLYEVETSPEETLTSPLKSYYFSTKEQEGNTLAYYESISHLSVIRTKLREHQQNSDSLLHVDDFIKFYDMHRSANQPIINAHPVAQASSAVQLMTVYKAKGLEFESVFMLSLHDDVWGKKSRRGNNKITLSADIESIRYRGTTEDELLRLLFVAITRAKHHLFLTSHARTDSGKPTEPVKYLAEASNEDGRESMVLPPHHRKVSIHDHEVDELQEHIQTLWNQRHLNLDASLQSLLLDRLKSYQMSPTHLNSFVNLVYGGPESFLLGTLLRFPKAPSEAGEYGNAIHATLEHIEKHVKRGSTFDELDVEAAFEHELAKRYLPKDRYTYYKEKGSSTLRKYVTARQEMLREPAEPEVDFRQEGVLIGDAHLAGKIDRLEVNTKEKTIAIADYKTGKPHAAWKSDVSLHTYKQQLYFYKFLVEGSHTYAGYRVESARLEFVEPNTMGNIVEPLYLTFKDKEEAELKALIQEVYRRITSLDLPDTSAYKESMAGIKTFEKDLLNDKQ